MVLMRRLLILLFLVLVFLGSSVAAIYYYRSFPEYELTVEDQPLGEGIKIKEAVLEKGGYIAIQDSQYGKPGPLVFGNSGYLLGGVYRDLNLELGPPETREVSLEPGEYFVVLYQEEEQTVGGQTLRVFEEGSDKPAKSPLGEIVAERIRLE